jgi:NADPH-dependent glutamate synthase beta subunit-like oxidoreductase
MGPQHVVLIVGGAVSGSEVALQLALRGILCVVIDQNPRPYGKIEDGLPRWHAHLRRQEMDKIDQRLGHPGVHFAPRTRLGRDTDLRELLGWGPSAVVLAVGAWRDRPLPLPGVDRYAGRGFYYQNPFIYWFNHYPEPGYSGPQVELADGALVVGGGLASLDVVKALMLETVTRALAARGHVVDLFDLERRGIAAALTERGLTLVDLGLRGCTLAYRRGVEDMPVAEVQENSTPEQTERVRATRRKLMHKFLGRYLCGFREYRAPVGLLADGDRLGGLRLAATEVRGGRVIILPGTEEDVPSRLTVSSVGSIPEPLDGIPMDGEVYRIKDVRSGQVDGLEGVFAAGNAVTGKGNITASLRHGRLVAQHVLEDYLRGTASGYEGLLADAEAGARAGAAAVAEYVAARAPMPDERVAPILERVRDLQRRAGYPGDYRAYAAGLARL